MTTPSRGDLARVFGRIEVTAGSCWLWTGARLPKGYGRIRFAGGLVVAHRLMHEWFVGPVPSGHQVDHLCRKTPCVNPAHLEAVPATVNRQRQEAARHGLCRKGHLLSGANVVHMKRNVTCRQCRDTRMRLWRAGR